MIINPETQISLFSMSYSSLLLNYDVGSLIRTRALCQIISQSLSLLFFFSLSLSLQILQEVIDIFEGVQDDQAVRMAANLGFKGPLQRQVMGAEGFKVTMQRRA